MDGQFIQMSSVALHLYQGTVRETMVTVLYALDSVGNVWKLIDQGGQKWTLMTNAEMSCWDVVYVRLPFRGSGLTAHP